MHFVFFMQELIIISIDYIAILCWCVNLEVKIDNINDFELFKRNKSEDRNYQYDYILGYFENNIFKKIAKIYFNKIDEFYEVDTIYVSPDMRKDGIASELYTYFVKELN